MAGGKLAGYLQVWPQDLNPEPPRTNPASGHSEFELGASKLQAKSY